MVAYAFIEKNIYIYWLNLTDIPQIKSSHTSENYVSQLYYVTQGNQDMKIFLFKFPWKEGVAWEEWGG